MNKEDFLTAFAEADINSATMTGVIDNDEIVKSFIEKNGEEVQRTTKDFTNNAIGSGYSIDDAFIELTDDAYDSIDIHDRAINFSIDVDNKNHMFTFRDDGDGIKDPDKLFMLGGTDKKGRPDKIGKYGIGVSGAVAAISTKCVYDENKPVYIRYESCREGRKFIKLVLVTPDGNTTLGENKFEECDRSLHYTEAKFTNVFLEDSSSVMKSLEETFEDPLHNPIGINISFCGRQLGKTGKRTFIGDENVETVMVKNFETDVKFRIIGGNDSNDRSFEESGLRVYSRKTGRLLAKDNKLWRWFTGREAQQNICGLRAAMYIEDSLESYKTFNVSATKNGIDFKEFFKRPEFKELSEKLLSIYQRASNTRPSSITNEIKVGSKKFVTTSGKIGNGGDLYLDLGETVVMKKKYTPQEIASIISENISLKKRLDRKNKK